MSETDQALKMYRESHQAVARYTVYLSTGFGSSRKVIGTGLPWLEAKAQADELNEQREARRFGDPIYGLQLENPGEALANVRRVASGYWASRSQNQAEEMSGCAL